MAECPTIDQLQLLLAEALAEDERTSVEKHVEHCKRCQQILERLTLASGEIETSMKPAGRPTAADVSHNPGSEAFFEQLKQTGQSINNGSNDRTVRHIEIDGYDILGELGRGAVGVVYRARHRSLNRIVALKVILAGPHLSPEMRQRFRVEAQAIARLKHPKIVQIYDVGEYANIPFLSLELIEGVNLAQWLAGKPRPAIEAAKIIASLAKAVEFAHSHGVIHRDLKPGNVLLSQVPGRPGKRELKVTDFGIAKLLPQGGIAEKNMTQTGEILGTPAYMAPEQARGKAGDICPATDVYSMGAILYEMLTGRPPFQGATSLDTLIQAAKQDPVSVRLLVPRVPRDLETICFKCLEKDPGKRYRSAADLVADVERFLNAEPILARPLSRAGHALRWVRRHKGLAASLSGIAAIIGLVTVGSLIASGYFRAMEAKQRALAQENLVIAEGKETERIKAVVAERNEAELRRRAESISGELRQNLYLNQMMLGAQLAMSPTGIGRICEWLKAWGSGEPDLRGWEWYYLNALCHRDLATLTDINSVVDITWDSQGKLLASGNADGTVLVWDGIDGGKFRQFSGHRRQVSTVAWSPNAKLLASASYDGTVKIWDVAAGKESFTFKGHTAPVRSIAWSPDGSRVASCSDDLTVRIWEIATGKIDLLLQGNQTKAVRDVKWSPDGTTIASAGEDTAIHLWDAKTGEETRVLRSHQNFVNRIAWSPDGLRLASASNDFTAKVWDIKSGKELLTLRGHSMGVSSVAWSRDGSKLATAGDDHTIKLWASKDGRALATLRGHANQVTAVAWNPSNEQLASSSFDRTIKFWNASAGPELPVLAGHQGPVNAVAWSPDNRHLASASDDTTVRIWDVASAKQPLILTGHTDAVYAVAWSPDGTRVASAGVDHEVRFWNAADGRPINSLPVTSGTVRAIAWSPDGSHFAAGGDESKVRVWDLSTGRQVAVCAGHESAVLSLAWSPDGKQLASGAADQTARIWNPVTGQQITSLAGHVSGASSVAWSPDEKSLATASTDQSLKIWDAMTGKLRMTLLGHTTRVESVSWSPDGQRLASGGDDHTLKLWDANTGKETFSVDCHGSLVSSVAWSPDGLSIAVGLYDQSVLIYNAAKGYLADRSPLGLPALDRDLSDNAQNADGWLLRARIDGCRQDWPEAATDMQHYLALHLEKQWETLGNWVVGPFPDDFDASYAAEVDPNPGIPVAPGGGITSRSFLPWIYLPFFSNDEVDFGALYNHAEHISAYNLLKVYSASARDVAVLLGSDDQNRLWLNGTNIHNRTREGSDERDAEAVPAHLRAGWNNLLIRVINVSGDHKLHLRLSSDPQDLKRATLQSAAP